MNKKKAKKQLAKKTIMCVSIWLIYLLWFVDSDCISSCFFNVLAIYERIPRQRPKNHIDDVHLWQIWLIWSFVVSQPQSAWAKVWAKQKPVYGDAQ